MDVQEGKEWMEPWSGALYKDLSDMETEKRQNFQMVKSNFSKIKTNRHVEKKTPNILCRLTTLYKKL